MKKDFILNHVVPSAFYGVARLTQLQQNLDATIRSFDGQFGIFAGDNLVTVHKNLSFLED